ncbi:MAG: ATP-binding protein [Alphaproteobacteria bacterium]|nr:ATP-binding protein [Alphaproteobacteria bacterium]
MIKRRHRTTIEGLLGRHPAVALLGPRQSGKTTLALEIAEGRPSTYLDLEAPSDLAKLAEPQLYLAPLEDKLVILDEVHRVPDLFKVLRGLIDAGRRRGRRVGRFLLLGSASIDLLKQSSESLAGRIAYAELTPFDASEVVAGTADMDRHWLRGGFPDSFLASGDRASAEWREAFIRTYLERDIPQLGPRVPAETLRRFWTMLAHDHGGLLNAARIAQGLGVSGNTVARYLDLLVDLLLVRRLEPWRSNIGKRMVKSPRVFVRDSGIVHALLGLATRDDLLGHPVVGASWEGYVIETLLSLAPPGTRAGFYRTSAGAEIDLVLALGPKRLWALEVKRSLTPRPSKGFWLACQDLEPDLRFVIYPGTERFPLKDGLEAIGLMEIISLVTPSS